MTFPVRWLLSVPQSWPPTLLVVVDTEEEFDWDEPFDPSATSVRNILEQPHAQAIFDTHGVQPAYCITYPVAISAEAEILRHFAREGRCSIGAHLHPWVTPPHEGPVQDAYSFPGNLPKALERAKLETLTEVIAEQFGTWPTIYKAGRYGIGPGTAETLDALGYRLDCSIVPRTKFYDKGGPDFTGYDDEPFMASDTLLEVPLSVHFVGMAAQAGPRAFPLLNSSLGRRLRLPGIMARTGLLERLRLTPEGHRLPDLVRQTKSAVGHGKRLFMMTYHSSTLMPGGSPYVKDDVGRKAFLDCLAGYCAFFMETLGGRPGTLPGVAAALLADGSMADRAA